MLCYMFSVFPWMTSHLHSQNSTLNFTSPYQDMTLTRTYPFHFTYTNTPHTMRRTRSLLILRSNETY
ncbi:hypothetical protein BDR06DRAFT_696729 [Suillus hirtellus]|nr:hypothetical protein BDR06DRAFT_696729 [Suillus hirtellus]